MQSVSCLALLFAVIVAFKTSPTAKVFVQFVSVESVSVVAPVNVGNVPEQIDVPFLKMSQVAVQDKSEVRDTLVIVAAYGIIIPTARLDVVKTAVPSPNEIGQPKD